MTTLLAFSVYVFSLAVKPGCQIEGKNLLYGAVSTEECRYIETEPNIGRCEAQSCTHQNKYVAFLTLKNHFQTTILFLK